ncbi:MAG: helix-turn-helix transcriptional regulator [Phreatobacter sp.]|uniref:helix-turn-helix domain-containing protein n=1 Tax=Phreatobacter sp. TaxID=1966341 RepID=UPI001A5F4DAF|nr:helix-turn-helix transcriptional regulator [Phreatobacter sp.]
MSLPAVLVSRDNESAPPFHDLDGSRLVAAVDLIQADYFRALSVPEIAQRAGMSRSHFTRYFADAFRDHPVPVPVARPGLPRGPPDLRTRASPEDHCETCELGSAERMRVISNSLSRLPPVFPRHLPIRINI